MKPINIVIVIIAAITFILALLSQVGILKIGDNIMYWVIGFILMLVNSILVGIENKKK